MKIWKKNKETCIPSTAIGPAPSLSVTQLPTDGIHCRESAGTWIIPVVLKVVPVTGAAFSGITIDQFLCASFFRATYGIRNLRHASTSLYGQPTSGDVYCCSMNTTCCTVLLTIDKLQDGTAELVSRDQILRRERGQGNINFPCSGDHVQDWQLYPVDLYTLAICATLQYDWKPLKIEIQKVGTRTDVAHEFMRLI